MNVSGLSHHAAMILEARLLLLAYGSILAAMVAFDWWAPLWLWLLPLLLGEPVMRAIRVSEHVGRPTVADMRVDTRTNLVNPLWRFLDWNMNYRAEHHYAASVPFHALHEQPKGHLNVEADSYLGAHHNVIAQLTGRKACVDAPA